MGFAMTLRATCASQPQIIVEDVTVNQFAAVSDIPGLCWYRQLTPGDVPAGMVGLVERVCALLSEELRIDPRSVQIKWATYENAQVAQSERGEALTGCDTDPFEKTSVTLLPCRFGCLVPNLSTSVIVLNAALPYPEDLVHAAIEELYHVHQHRTWAAAMLEDAVNCEVAASEYVEQTMPRIMEHLARESVTPRQQSPLFVGIRDALCEEDALRARCGPGCGVLR